MSDVFAKTLNYRFIGFGALLYYIRDRNLGKPFKTDLDVCVLGQIPVDEIERAFADYGLQLKNKILDDRTHLPYQLVFEYRDKVTREAYSVDMFFWVLHNKHWWHTFDSKMEFTRKDFKGIPSEYLFKGIRQSAMIGEIAKYNWEEIAPDMNFPKNYGTLLDIWYPDWIHPRQEQSHADKIVKLKTCVDLERKLK